jgi:hypothetical protein
VLVIRQMDDMIVPHPKPQAKEPKQKAALKFTKLQGCFEWVIAVQKVGRLIYSRMMRRRGDSAQTTKPQNS